MDGTSWGSAGCSGTHAEAVQGRGTGGRGMVTHVSTASPNAQTWVDKHHCEHVHSWHSLAFSLFRFFNVQHLISEKERKLIVLIMCLSLVLACIVHISDYNHNATVSIC